jgi:tetratricopeptide (TPR) repeat protein
VWEQIDDIGTGLAPVTAAVRTLPHDLPTFTGRHRELHRLLDGPVGIVAIDGMAGVGKTTLAVHAAHRLATRFPDGQLFLDLHAHTAGQSPVSPADALYTLLCFTGMAPTAIPAGLDERAALWRSRVAGRRVLVVLDNVVGHEQVRPLLPGTPGCCVVLTSRRRLAALDGTVTMPLDILPPDDAAALFVRMAGTGDRDEPAVRALTAQVGYLPLAIRLLGGWLRGHPSWSVTDLVDELATAKDRSAAIRAENVIVGAAFDMSFDALRARLRAFFVSLGAHPGADFDAPTAAALAGVDEDEARQSLDELYNDHLVEEPVRGRYQFHDLIRDYARGLSATRPVPETDEAMTRLMTHYSTTAGSASTQLHGTPMVPAAGLTTRAEAARWFATELPNLLATIDHTADRHGPAAAQLSLHLRSYLSQRGRWRQAITLYERTRHAASDAPLVQAAVLRHLGLFHRRLGEVQPAESYLRAALAIYGELADQIGKASTLGQLGTVYREHGALPTALDYTTQALVIFREIGNLNGVATQLSEVGALQSRLGDHDAARETMWAALKVCDETGDRANESNLLRMLADIELKAGLIDEAETAVNQALVLARDTAYLVAQADALNVLGAVHQARSHPDDALAAFGEALEIYADIGDRRGHTTVLNRIGMLTCDRDPGSARRVHVFALRAARAMANSALEAQAWEGLGRAFVASGDTPLGLHRLRRAVAIYDRIGDHDRCQVIDLIRVLESGG